MHPPPPPPPPPPRASRPLELRRRPWPPDIWDALLKRHGCNPSIQRKAELPAGQRAWAYDVPRAKGATAGAPKRWLAASVDDLVDMYYKVREPERHAYEVLEPTRFCHLFFDLDGTCDGSGATATIASRIADEAAASQ